MKGDVREIQIAAETMGDGAGGELSATVVRIWTASDDAHLELTVSAELRVARDAPSELDALDDFLKAYLSVFGLGDLA